MSGRDAVEIAWDQIGEYQMALRVVHELLDGGPGNAAQLAERITEKDEEGYVTQPEWVVDALLILDSWSVLDLPGPENEDGPIALWGQRGKS